MNEFDYLIGKSVIGFRQLHDDLAYLLISDGSKLKFESEPEPDCCGYNHFTVSIPEGFDFEDNVIMNITYSEEDDDWGDACGDVKLGVFTNHKCIQAEGSWGSGSGWNYGQFVSFTLVKEVAE